jgi:uncharacterized membrane protein YgdD (TMEM256/DUF423 family)
MSTRILQIWAGLLGFTGVGLGAFGAHALKERLAASGHTGTWTTAVHYHLLHAAGLLALIAWIGVAGGSGARHVRRAAWCWIAGTLLFSGSLYALALGGPRWLGPVTPVGGMAFLIGWALLAFSRRTPKTEGDAV